MFNDPGDAAKLAHATQHTVLCVEDNLGDLCLIDALVARRADIHLLTALDGRSGIEMSLVRQADVVLLDINLPDINGLQALHMLAENPATAHIPVIALSAGATPLDIDKGLQDGFFRYLIKPIHGSKLMDTLDAALSLAVLDRRSLVNPGRVARRCR